MKPVTSASTLEALVSKINNPANDKPIYGRPVKPIGTQVVLNAREADLLVKEIKEFPRFQNAMTTGEFVTQQSLLAAFAEETRFPWSTLGIGTTVGAQHVISRFAKSLAR